MIVIYNLGGLLLGLAGVVVAFAAIAISQSVALGVVGAGLLWTIFGWRRKTVPPELPRVSPSIFFIPLRIWGILLLVLAAPLHLVERFGGDAPNDPRRAALRLDLDALRASQHSGDVALSRLVQEGINDIAIAEIKAEQYHVRSRLEGDRALVLVEASDLKRLSEKARIQLLDLVESLVRLTRPAVKDLYIGIRGRVAFGAMRTPEKATQTGSVVSDAALLSFFTQPVPPLRRPSTTAASQAN